MEVYLPLGKWWWPLKTQNYVTPIPVHYPVNVKLVTQITKEVKARNVSGVSPFLVNFLRHTWVQIFLPPERIKRRNSKRKWTWMKITVFMTETPQLLVERLVRIFITFGDNDASFYHFLSELGVGCKKKCSSHFHIHRKRLCIPFMATLHHLSSFILGTIGCNVFPY